MRPRFMAFPSAKIGDSITPLYYSHMNPQSHPGLDALGRFGYFSRGVVYLTIGGIAARAALLSHGRAMGPGGALRAILSGPYGLLLVGIIMAGLCAFSIFRLAQALYSR